MLEEQIKGNVLWRREREWNLLLPNCRHTSHTSFLCLYFSPLPLFVTLFFTFTKSPSSIHNIKKVLILREPASLSRGPLAFVGKQYARTCREATSHVPT
ncbi:hypothetical protein YC2023_067487 [Brassica napus]